MTPRRPSLRFSHHVSMRQAKCGSGAEGAQIHKVYEVDPLACPKCQGPMSVIALVDDAHVIERILKHLGLWAPRQSAPQYERPPPRCGPEGGETKPASNVLTYHPVPDIA